MSGHDIEGKITELHRQTTAYLSELKNWIIEQRQPKRVQIISYFTYSLDIAHDVEEESICFGTFHIHNIGDQVITNPVILIQLPKESPFSFSGKYVYGDFKQSLKPANGWERLNAKEDREEFWLKPLGKQFVEPDETISFSDFQIRWSPKESYAGSVMAYTYCDEIKEGTAVMNPISLNGTVRTQEDENG